MLADSRSQELFELLKRDRALQVPTIQDQLNSRRFAENLLGPDENIFRIDWVRLFYFQVFSGIHARLELEQLPDTKTMTVQLLGKDDSRIDDSEMLAERWQAYVDSFVSVRVPYKSLLSRGLMGLILQSPVTEGISQSRVGRPFLRKCVYVTLYLSLTHTHTNANTCFAGTSLPRLLPVPQRCSRVAH